VKALVFIAAASLAIGLMSPRISPAQTTDSARVLRSTMAGVFTVEQATRGESTFASVCLSCHTVEEQQGAAFTKKWVGFPLWDLYDYVATSMPQSDPGTLSPKEYAQVIAYLLKINGMPAGKDEIASDTAALKWIKVDTTKIDTTKIDTLTARYGKGAGPPFIGRPSRRR
jgi:mono/diheme cytochrome c family protein